jgi:hypothetical protein
MTAAPSTIEQVALLRDAVRLVADRLDQATKDPATAGHQVANARDALDYAREAAAELARAFPGSHPPAAREA